MSNHYHLLLETPAGNLVAGMQWLQSTFQARYKAVVIDSEEPEYGNMAAPSATTFI